MVVRLFPVCASRAAVGLGDSSPESSGRSCQSDKVELRLFLVVMLLRRPPLLSSVPTGASEAWRHANDTGYPRRVRAITGGHARNGCGRQRDHFRSRRLPTGSVLHCDVRPTQRLLRSEVLGPPVWQGRRGSTRGGDVARESRPKLAEPGILNPVSDGGWRRIR